MQFYFLFITLLFTILTKYNTFAEIEEEEDVLVLTDDNFEEAVLGNEILLVEFYAPWCGHCKNLAPEYAKAATTLKELDTPIRIAKMDATANSKYSEKYGVQGFPTIKLFRGSIEAGDVTDYDGGRTATDIEKWMIKKSGPAVQIIEDEEALTALKEKNDVVIVAYLDTVDGEEKQILEKVAGKDENAIYVATSSDSLKKDKKTPSITLFKNFDEGQNEFDGEFTEDSITSFVKGNSMPLVLTFSQEKASKIFGGDVQLHLLMFVDTEKEYFTTFETKAKEVAAANKGKLLHIFIPLSESRILDYFGFKEADLPAIMLVNMAAGMKKYPFTKKGDDLVESFESTFGDDLTAFENEYFDGKLSPTLKSAEPFDDSEEAVKVISGNEFEERVINSDKDVLLEFYAPWCGHCKNLAPKYEELAEKFSSVDSIMIAKMDATENEIDHPKVDVQGFPTIFFFPKGDKANPVQYDGGRDVQGFTEYLKKHASKFDLEGESHGHDEL